MAIGVIAPTSMVARHAVIPAILASTSCHLEAVASRSAPAVDGGPTTSLSASAPALAPALAPARHHRSYEDHLADPAVEAVYIPLPNSMHREWAERSAAAGKHVLCEKPLSSSPSDTLSMSIAAAAAGVVLMEAYMTPFHPRSRAFVECVRSGVLGELLFASAAFTGELTRADDHRWRPEMGGGCLLDVGIYCLAPILAAFGVSAGDVRVGGASARRNDLGVDASFSGWLDFGHGRSASIQCSFEAPERQLLEVVGTKAVLSVDRAFTPGLADRALQLRHADGTFGELTSEGGDPYLLMVDHFADVVRGRAVQERPPADSLDLADLVARLDDASMASLWAAEAL